MKRKESRMALRKMWLLKNKTGLVLNTEAWWHNEGNKVVSDLVAQ